MLTRDFEGDFWLIKALEKGDARASAAESNVEQSESGLRGAAQNHRLSLIVNTDQSERDLTTYFEKLDECKPADAGTKILITASTGGCAVLDRTSQKVLFYAYVPNAHSIELSV